MWRTTILIPNETEPDPMSLEKKSIHVRVPQELHECLSTMSDFYNKDMAELAAAWLEKVIVGEFHSFSVLRERLKRLELKGR